MRLLLSKKPFPSHECFLALSCDWIFCCGSRLSLRLMTYFKFLEMRAAFNLGDYESSLRVSENILQTSTDNLEFHRIRIQSFSRLQRHEEAMDACEIAISSFPADPALCHLAVSVAIAAKDFVACQELFLRLARAGGPLNCALLFNVLKNATIQMGRRNLSNEETAASLDGQIQLLRGICDATGRRLLLLIGNCQTPVLAEILNNTPAFAAHHFAYSYKGVHACSPSELAQLAGALDRFDCVVTQNLYADTFGALRTAEVRAAYHGQLVTIPTCWFNILSLDAFRLSGSLGANPDMNMHSLFLAQAFLDGLSEERAVSFYHEASHFTDKVLRDRFQETIHEIRRREKELDITISDYILENFTTRRLFHSYNHPAIDILLDVCKSLSAILGFAFPKIPENYAKFDRLANPLWNTHHKIRSYFQLGYMEKEEFVFNNQRMNVAQFAHREYATFMTLDSKALAGDVLRKTEELLSGPLS